MTCYKGISHYIIFQWGQNVNKHQLFTTLTAIIKQLTNNEKEEKQKLGGCLNDFPKMNVL
jgi:hypothetical protein